MNGPGIVPITVDGRRIEVAEDSYVLQAATALIRTGADVTDGVLNRIEMPFRAYDLCLGCATHALAGQMPMEIVIRGLDGSVRETVRRLC